MSRPLLPNGFNPEPTRPGPRFAFVPDGIVPARGSRYEQSVSHEKHTPLYDEHVALGAKLVPFAGWSMPLQYAGIKAEHDCVRESAGLFDVSHMGQLRVFGPDCVAVVNSLVPNDVARLRDGQGLYTCCCNEAGGVLDDLIIYRRSATEVLVVCNASNHDKIAQHFAAHTADRCGFEDVGAARALLALQGPRALEILKRVGAPSSIDQEVRRFHIAEATLAGRRCSLARTGYTGEDGVEVFCERDDAVALWRALLDAGQALGLAPIGLGARDTLRLEACLPLYGNELDETTTPYDAQLAWTVKPASSPFIGDAALARARTEEPRRRLVGFEMLGRGVARHGYPLLDRAGKVVGTCTSGAPSPTLGKGIGLGYVPPALSAVGTRLLVDCRGKSIECAVVPTPFYRRAGLKQ